ncbi:MAG: hypothetical protein Q7R47_02360, partial [Candidatus Diapherotrites archaeon]|nr:hypothetical protein [Candidatus Diapherotrites archaeon]
VNSEHLVALNDLLSKQSFNTIPSDLRELVSELRKKHVVDSISISQPNGSLLASSDQNGASEVITASALFNYVQSEVPKSEVVLIKGQNVWNMLFKFNGKIFTVKAPMHLTTVELRRISDEVEAFLEKAQKKTPDAETKKAQGLS